MSIMSMQRKNTERSKITQQQLIGENKVILFSSWETTIQFCKRIIQVSSERHRCTKLAIYTQAQNSNDQRGHLKLNFLHVSHMHFSPHEKLLMYLFTCARQPGEGKKRAIVKGNPNRRRLSQNNSCLSTSRGVAFINHDEGLIGASYTTCRAQWGQ